MAARLYTVRYESSTFSGSRQVMAQSPAEALTRFREEWSEQGDEVPTCWVDDGGKSVSN